MLRRELAHAMQLKQLARQRSPPRRVHAEAQASRPATEQRALNLGPARPWLPAASGALGQDGTGEAPAAEQRAQTWMPASVQAARVERLLGQERGHNHAAAELAAVERGARGRRRGDLLERHDDLAQAGRRRLALRRRARDEHLLHRAKLRVRARRASVRAPGRHVAARALPACPSAVTHAAGLAAKTGARPLLAFTLRVCAFPLLSPCPHPHSAADRPSGFGTKLSAIAGGRRGSRARGAPCRTPRACPPGCPRTPRRWQAPRP